MEGIYNSELVNKVYPEAVMIKAMRIWSLPESKANMLQECCDSGEYFAQIKKDGYWYEFNRTENYGYLFSRTESKVTGLLSEKSDNVPHIKEALMKLPPNTIVIGEIYIPGGTSKNVTTIMGCLPKKAQERIVKENVDIRYYIHDIIMLNGVSLLKTEASKRYSVLESAFKLFLADNPCIELAQAFDNNIYELASEALANGEEGIVMKKKNWVYTPGKKPAWSGIKVKKVDYADVICIGLEDATKEYTGKETKTPLGCWNYWFNEETQERVFLNNVPMQDVDRNLTPVTKPFYHKLKTSIVIGAYDDEGKLVKIGTVSSGLTDELRESLTIEPEKYIGQVFMVQCMEKDANSKSMRHPIYRGFRDDKNASECTLAEIFN